MEFLDIRFFDFIKRKDSILQYRRRSDHSMVTAIAFPEYSSPADVNEAFFQNLELLNQLSHPNIIKTLGHSVRDTDNGSELLVFIEQSEGTLEDFLGSEILTKDDVKSILRDVMLTLLSIEEKLNNGPCFLTPRNIVVTKNYFGENTFKLLCPFLADNSINLKSENARWTSPEVYQNLYLRNGTISYKNFKNSLIYSLGLLSIFMITGDDALIQERNISSNDEFSSQIKDLEEKNIRKYISETAGQLKDAGLMDLILKMLKFNPNDRINLSELISKVNPSGNIASNADLREQGQNNSNPGSYAVFVDQSQGRQIQHAGRVAPDNIQNNQGWWRCIKAPDFDPKTFTFFITSFQIIVFLITTIYHYMIDIPSCTLYFFGASYTPAINYYHEVHRLFTPIFLHANLLHLVMNMTGQYYVGFTLEKFVGIKQFSLIYLLSGIIGNLLASCMNINSLGVGASTSLFGLLHLKFLHDTQHMDIRVAEKNYIKQLIFCFMFSLLPGISFYGHLGGWIGGVLVSTILLPVHPNHSLLFKLKSKAVLILVLGIIISLIYIFTLKGLDQLAYDIDTACHSLF